MKNEAFEVSWALRKDIDFICSDAGYDFWDRITKDIRLKKEQLKDIDFFLEHEQEWPLINFDRPDVIYEDNDNIVGIECFQFDASASNRKGSRQFREQQLLEKDLLSQHYKNGETYLRGVNNVELSYPSYVKSAIDGLKNHYKNIADYKCRLAEHAPGKTITIVFFIHDATFLGSYALTERGGIEALSILCVKEFLDVLSMCPEIDFIISCSQNSAYDERTIIMENSQKVLANLYSETYDESKISFINKPTETIMSFSGTQKKTDIL